QLSVVVIMQDQERTAEGLIGELLAGQATAGLVTDIVAVDLGSRDNTPAILQRIARQHGHVRSVLMPPGTSSEEAVAAAVKQCRSPLPLCLDASRTRDLGLVRQTLPARGLDPAAAPPPATESHSAWRAVCACWPRTSGCPAPASCAQGPRAFRRSLCAARGWTSLRRCRRRMASPRTGSAR